MRRCPKPGRRGPRSRDRRVIFMCCCSVLIRLLLYEHTASCPVARRQSRQHPVVHCTQRRSVISPVQTTSETDVGRWRNHTKAPRQLFHHRIEAASGAATKRGNKKRTGLEMEGRLVFERRLWIRNRRSRWLAPPARTHRQVDLKRGEQGSPSLRLRAVSGRDKPAKDRKNSRGGHARPCGRSTPPREAPVPRNFP